MSSEGNKVVTSDLSPDAGQKTQTVEKEVKDIDVVPKENDDDDVESTIGVDIGVSRWASLQTEPCDLADRELQNFYADRDKATSELSFCPRQCRKLVNFFKDLFSLRSQYPNPNRRAKLRGTDVRRPWLLRRLCIRLSESILFREVFLIFVFIQTIYLAAAGKSGVGREGDGAYDAIDTLFTTIFTIEMAMLCIAEGMFVGPYSYFKDTWHYLDLFCVLFGWLKYYFGENYMAVFRTARLLVPISRLNLLPGLDVITQCVLGSVGQLVEVVAINVFFMLFFALIGVQLYMGMLRNRCQSITTGEWEDSIFRYEPDSLCSTSKSFGRQCETGWQCNQYHTNPWYGAVSFDNIGVALLNIFVVVSKDGWTRIMFFLEDVSFSASRAYVIVVVLIGNLFLINLLIALITLRFDSERTKMRSKILARELEKKKLLDELRMADEVKRKEQEQLLVDKCNEGKELSEEDRKRLMELSKDPTKFSTKILDSRSWNLLHFFSVLASLGVLAINEFQPSEGRKTALFGGHAALCAVFTLEVLLKIHSQGFRLWYFSGYNLFECILTILMFMEFITRTDPNSNMGVFGALSSLRFVILLDFMKTWRPVQLILSSVLRSITDILPLMVLVFLYMYLFAVITMQRLQDTFEEINHRYIRPVTSPEDRWIGFGTFGWSCLSIFQIMTGENWFRMMYHAIGARGWFMAPLFILIYLVGNIVFISSVAAIMLGNFTDVADELDKEEKKRRENPEAFKLTGFPLMMEQIKQFLIKVLCLEKILARFTKPPEVDEAAVYRINEVRHADEKLRDRALNKELANFAFSFVSVHQRESRENAEQRHLAEMKAKAEADQRLLSRADLVDLYGTSCCCLWPDHPMRLYSSNLVFHRLYWLISTGFVLLGVVILAVREPKTKPGSYKKKLMDGGDILMCAGFAFEFILKWIAFGLYGHKGSYLSDPWNWLDFSVVIAHTVYLIVTALSEDDTVQRIFICFLSIRALRVLVSFERTKKVLLATMVTVPSFLKIIIMSGVFYLFFGILGVALFAGKFRRCYRPDGLPEFSLNEVQCLLGGGIWTNPPDGNFDDIAGALRTLYQIGTTDGWTKVMFLAIDATPSGLAPEINYNTPIALYFFVFVILAAFFVVSVFIAFVAFTYMRLAQSASEVQDVDQINDHWINSWGQILEVIPKRSSTDLVHKSVFRSKCYLLVTSAGWEIALAILIVLNTVSMSMDIYNASDHHEFILSIFNHIFVGIFLLELVFRWFALGNERFWGENWNVADAVLVSLSIVGWCVEVFSIEIGFRPRLLRVPRMIRMARVTRVVKRLQPLANTIIVSFKQLISICFLLIVVLIMYAYMGMILFGRVRRQTHLNGQSNFENFSNALQLSFAIATGENWTSFMHECQISPPHCIYADDYTNECGWPTLSLVYFISFSMITTFVFLNLFVAVLLQNFKHSAELLPMPMTAADARMITALWSKETTAKFTWVLMTIEQFINFIEDLPLPFGLDLTSTSINEQFQRETFELWQFFEECPIPVRVYTLAEATTLGIDYKDRMRDEYTTDKELFVHYADIMLGLCARRFRKTFNSYDPSKINKSEASWRAVRQRYSERFDLKEADIVLPLNGVRALYMVIGHWRLLRTYYYKGKALELKEQDDLERQQRLALQQRDVGAHLEDKKDSGSQIVEEKNDMDVPLGEDDDDDEYMTASKRITKKDGSDESDQGSESEENSDSDSDDDDDEAKKKMQEKDDAELIKRPTSRYSREVRIHKFSDPKDAVRAMVDAQLYALNLPPEVRTQISMAQMQREVERKKEEDRKSEQAENIRKAQQAVSQLMQQLAGNTEHGPAPSPSSSSRPLISGDSEADTDISLESRSRRPSRSSGVSSTEAEAPLLRSSLSRGRGGNGGSRPRPERRVQFGESEENGRDSSRRN